MHEPTNCFEGTPDHVGDPILLGIVTVSDRASQGEYEDEGGPAILGFFEEAIKSPGRCTTVVSLMNKQPLRRR